MLFSVLLNILVAVNGPACDAAQKTQFWQERVCLLCNVSALLLHLVTVTISDFLYCMSPSQLAMLQTKSQTTKLACLIYESLQSY